MLESARPHGNPVEQLEAMLARLNGVRAKLVQAIANLKGKP